MTTIATERDIDAVHAGVLAVFATAGRYGAAMASTYNCRARVAQVLADGSRFAVVADRIEPGAVLATQHLPFWMRTDVDRVRPFAPRRAA